MRFWTHQFSLHADCSSSCFLLKLISRAKGDHFPNCGWMEGHVLVRYVALVDDGACRVHSDDCSRPRKLLPSDRPLQDWRRGVIGDPH